MLSRLIPNPSFYGWRVLLAGLVLAALSGPGQSYLLSLYIDDLTESLSLTRLDISALYGAATILAALILPWIGALADRWSSRVFAGTVLALLGLAVLSLSMAKGLWTVAFAFFALRLLGQGAISLGIVTTVVRWFLRYRGRAFAVVSAGYATGEAIFPSVAVVLIAALGWRGSLVTLAVLYVFLFAPLLAWSMRERDPETEPLDGTTEAPSERVAGLYTDVSWEPKEALRTPVFWTLLICSCISPFLLTGLIFHMPAIFRSAGWDVAVAPRAFAAYAVAGMASTYLMGLLLERVHSRIGLTVSLLALAIGVATLFFPFGATNGPWLFGAALGGSAGVSHAANGVIWPAYFGVESLGALRGVVNAARNGCTAVAPPLAAWLAGPSESFGSFAMLCVSLAAGFALVSVLVPRRATSRTLALGES